MPDCPSQSPGQGPRVTCGAYAALAARPGCSHSRSQLHSARLWGTRAPQGILGPSGGYTTADLYWGRASILEPDPRIAGHSTPRRGPPQERVPLADAWLGSCAISAPRERFLGPVFLSDIFLLSSSQAGPQALHLNSRMLRAKGTAQLEPPSV